MSVRERGCAWNSSRTFSVFVTEPFLWQGAVATVEISALAMVGGVAFGLVLALMRLSRFALFRVAGVDLHLVHPRHAAASPARLPLRRAAAARHQARQLHDRRGRLRPQRGGLQRRDHSRRHPVGEPQPGHRRRRLRHGAVPDAPADHPAAGDAGHSARARQRLHQRAQGHLDRLGDLRQRADLPGAADRRPELQVLHRVRRRRHHLPDDHERGRDRAVVSRAALQYRARAPGARLDGIRPALREHAGLGSRQAGRRSRSAADDDVPGASSAATDRRRRTGSRRSPTQASSGPMASRPSSNAEACGRPMAAARCCAAST